MLKFSYKKEQNQNKCNIQWSEDFVWDFLI